MEWPFDMLRDPFNRLDLFFGSPPTTKEKLFLTGRTSKVSINSNIEKEYLATWLEGVRSIFRLVL